MHPEVCWYESGLPVMAVDDIGTEINRFAGLQNSPREKRKTLGVIRVIPFVGSIEAGPSEIAFVVDEIDRDAFFRFRGPYITGFDPTADRDTHVFARFFDVEFLAADRLVFGQHDPDIVTLFAQFF